MDIFEESFNAQVELANSFNELDFLTNRQRKFQNRAIAKIILYIEQEGKCCFCKGQMYCHYLHGKPPKGQIATIEHVTCKTMGGGNNISNYKLSCSRCNNARGITDFHLFANIVKSHEDRENFIKHKKREFERIRVLKAQLSRQESIELQKAAESRKAKNRLYAAECNARHQAKLLKKAQTK